MTSLSRSPLRPLAVLLLGLALLLGLTEWSRGRPAAPATGKATPAEPAQAEALSAEWLRPLTWRCIGPAAMGGRITALSVFEADPTTYWVATASGGLLKTTNNGTTFEHQFDREATVSLGDVCVAPSDRNIVWVGTGENNPRNSVSYGDGVYKSTDGGKSWKNVGLKKSFQIGKIVIHPTNPDVVYVGALGRLYGPSEERGLYKTTDGGKTWERVHFVDNKTGVIDLRMHPGDPETLLVATYERQRDGFDGNDPAKKWGPGSGLYKTSDGGKTFKKLTKGLPTCDLGRLGIDYYRKDPNTVFLILESEQIGMGPARPQIAYAGLFGQDVEDGGVRVTRVAEGGPADKAGVKLDDRIVVLGNKPVKAYADLLDQLRERKVGEKVKIKLRRAGKEMDVELTFAAQPAGRPGGGGRRGFDPKRPYAAMLGGQEANVQAQQGPQGYQYGGVYKSTDGGESWTRMNSINPRPMYFSHIRVDPSDDRYLYLTGVTLARSGDGGKTFRSDVRGVHADQHALWIDPRDGRHQIVGTDGGFYTTYDRMSTWDHHNNLALGQFYHVAVDTRARYHAYGGLQDNGSWGGPSRTRTLTGPTNEDWIRVGGADGFVCGVDPNDPDQIYFEAQNGNFQRRHLRTGEVARLRPQAPGGARPRFNWRSPFLLSHRNSKIYYCAGNYVFRSLDRGDDLRAISPKITRSENGSATALAESPRNPDVLYAGTDDGALWVTRDGGAKWTSIVENIKLPGPRCVASIEASRFADGRAYVVFDAHRSDDDNPYVFVTEDYGKTWNSLTANLPWGSTRVLREDVRNPNLLFVGTEFGAWASLNRGASWARLNNNLPTVAVHEFAIHPTVGEMVAATHGRSLWVLDITPLQQMNPEVFKDKPQLLKPNTAVRWQEQPSRGRSGRTFVGTNPPAGAQVYYSLPRKAESVRLRVLDIDDKVVAQLPASTAAGLHRVAWNLARGSARAAVAGQPGARQPGAGRPGAGRPGGRQPGGRPPGAGPGFGRAAQYVPAGSYRVVLTVDGKDLVQSIRVEVEAGAAAAATAAEEEEEEVID